MLRGSPLLRPSHHSLNSRTQKPVRRSTPYCTKTIFFYVICQQAVLHLAKVCILLHMIICLIVLCGTVLYHRALYCVVSGCVIYCLMSYVLLWCFILYCTALFSVVSLMYICILVIYVYIIMLHENFRINYMV